MFPDFRPRPLPQSRALSKTERLGLLLEIVLAYQQARLVLRRKPIVVAVETLRRPGSRRAPVLDGAGSGHRTLEEARRLGAAVSRALALVPGDTRCLARSLVLTRLLSRRSISSTLVIGTSTTPRFLAHAWVEHEGDAVLSDGGGRFARLVEL